MTNPRIVHGRYGNAWFNCDCVVQNGTWLTGDCTHPMCDIPMGYLTGKFKPNHPMPVPIEDAALSKPDATMMIYISYQLMF